MRRCLLLAIPLVALIGCGGDDTDEEGETLAEQFAENDPTFDECIDGLRQILASIEVPDGFDPEDGLDEDELAEAETAIDAAFEAEGLDPDGEDDPCAEHTGPEANAATADIFEDLDPDVRAMMSAVTAG